MAEAQTVALTLAASLADTLIFCNSVQLFLNGIELLPDPWTDFRLI